MAIHRVGAPEALMRELFDVTLREVIRRLDDPSPTDIQNAVAMLRLNHVTDSINPRTAAERLAQFA